MKVSDELESDANMKAAYNFIVVHDGLETMSDGDDRHVFLQLCAQGLLDDCIRLVI